MYIYVYTYCICIYIHIYLIVQWYHCVITSYDRPIHLTYQLSFSANRVTFCCKSFTTFVVWRNSYGALCGWVVASARCQQSKAQLTSLQIEISSPSLPTLLPQGWHSIFCQLINQSTNNTTYANNTRSIVYHSPRMQHHWTASTFHDSTRGTTPTRRTRIDSDTHIAWRKRAMSIFLAAPLRRAMPETKSFALRSWMYCGGGCFTGHPL